ncbi:MAG: hypothetical protein JXA82_04485, partial [Sedimentisphaerales bacterium]|nr:hypothetical protein [Sedimentisphaerales bacterium]
LPENVMVMDTRIRTSTDSASDSSDTPIQVGVIPNVNSAASDQNIDEDFELTDAQTFSVVFSKSGRLVTHDVRVWNRDGVYDDTSTDDIFNTLDNINVNQTGRFIQDNYPAMGLGQEPSRNCFWVFNRNEFEAVPATQRWSGFLRFQEELYVSPFTGEIVNKEKTNP